MAKILISHPIDQDTIGDLQLNQVTPANKDFADIEAPLFYAVDSDIEYLYVPSIATKQQPNEDQDPTLELLRQVLVSFQPDVLIVGNNAVPGFAIEAWRQAVGPTRSLQVIRRGVDKRAIDCHAAASNSVTVGNLPGINSPFVARHQIECLKLDRAQPNSKIGIIGVGNIGKNIALHAIKLKLDVHLFSPSLQDPARRDSILQARSLPPEKVTCAPSLDEVFRESAYVAIAVPGINSQGMRNIGLFSKQHVEKVSKQARISSASPPWLFSISALAWMNEQMKLGELYLRIDTAKRLAQGAKQDYPALDLAHDVAFSSRDCQIALDRAMLKKARDFIANAQNKSLMEEYAEASKVLELSH